MAHRESLDYLYGLQRFGIKLGLDNIRGLLARAGEPQQAMNLVHVAGTNGKGSVCAMLSALIQKAGHRTGLYTSPHLHDFSERIRVDGEPIAASAMAAQTETLKKLIADDIPATFFEFTTAMALCHFREQRVAWGVLETGMGGRLDATNAVVPKVVVITAISLDHAEHLGGSLAEVAAEKAGIIKPGVPVVCASQPTEVMQILERQAAKLKAPLYTCGIDFRVEGRAQELCYCGIERDCAGLSLPLEGEHQHDNLALALAALEAAGMLSTLTYEEVDAALAGVTWPGRLEWWSGKQQVLLDGAHNVASCRVLADYLEQRGLSGVRLIFGVKADKAASEMLATLLPQVSEVLLVAPPVDVAAELEPLAAQAGAAGVSSHCCADVESALRVGLESSTHGETLVVAGSLFLVAAAREALGNEE